MQVLVNILDFINGCIVLLGAIYGITWALNYFFGLDESLALILSIFCFGRFILKIGGAQNESNKTI